MSKIADMLKEAQVTPEQIQEIATLLQQNPMAALAKFQELSLPPNFLQEAMAAVLAQPDALQEAASRLGLDSDALDAAKQQLSQVMPQKPSDET